MANFLAPVINSQQLDQNGDPLSSGTIEVYLAGTSTPATTYTTQAGGTPNTFPIDLNTLGVNEDGEIWLIGGASYKFVIKDSAGVTLRTLDNMSGINDSTVTTDQWVVYQSAPTYVSATSFTVAGDQTQTFQIRRRLKTQNTGGLVYSTITNSVYSSPNTTVTVQNDSGVLDSGLSQVSYGIISALNSSLPYGLLIGVTAFTASGTFTPNAAAKRWLVKGQGAGGGGGGGTGTAAGQVSIGAGGAAGAIGETFISTSLLPSVAVTIGAGGVSNSGLAGGAGGTTSFGTHLSLAGGAGGATAASAAAVVVAGAAGGAATLGNVYLQPGQNSSGGGSSNAQGYACGTAGANSLYGGGGAPGAIGVGAPAIAAGGAATGRGAGGGGAAAVSGSGAVGGGVGTGGIIVVYEYA